MKTTTNTTTCQICARAIKANTGVIAHHGYQRPGMGWQTRSCFGAMHKPYEVSRDAIKACIISYTAAAAAQDEQAADLLANPPATITESSKWRDDSIYERPENFDGAAIALPKYSPTNGGYDNKYRKLYKTAILTAAEIREAITFLEQRYDAWEAK